MSLGNDFVDQLEYSVEYFEFFGIDNGTSLGERCQSMQLIVELIRVLHSNLDLIGILISSIAKLAGNRGRRVRNVRRLEHCDEQ